MRNQRGVAMLMALITMFVLAIIAGELVYQSGVYSSVVFRARDQLRASLLARSGLRLALLQVRATKKAKAKAKAMGLGDNASIVDKIWQTPMILPPPDIPGLAPSDTATLEAFRTSLGLEGTVNVTILGENGRMGINQMVWPPVNPNDVKGVSQGGTRLDPNNPLGPPPGSPQQNPNGQGATDALNEAKKKIHDSYVEIFNNMLDKKRQDDDAFRDKYANLTGDQMVGNILAWMDPNTANDGDNRAKDDFYGTVEPSPYKPKNAPIANSSEYHMIKGIDETLFKLVDDNFTVQNANSLDVNKASLLLIHSLIPDLTPDALERIGKRRTDETLGGPFKDANDFWTFLGTLGSYDDAKKKLTANGITILDPDSTYHAVITANSGVATKMWLADIGPMPPKDPLSTATSTATATQPQTTTQASNGSSTSTSTNTSTSDSSDLDSLSVVYLKSE